MHAADSSVCPRSLVHWLVHRQQLSVWYYRRGKFQRTWTATVALSLSIALLFWSAGVLRTVLMWCYFKPWPPEGCWPRCFSQAKRCSHRYKYTISSDLSPAMRLQWGPSSLKPVEGLLPELPFLWGRLINSMSLQIWLIDTLDGTMGRVS